MSNCDPTGNPATLRNNASRAVPRSSVVTACGVSPFPSVSQLVLVQSPSTVASTAKIFSAKPASISFLTVCARSQAHQRWTQPFSAFVLRRPESVDHLVSERSRPADELRPRLAHSGRAGEDMLVRQREAEPCSSGGTWW